MLMILPGNVLSRCAAVVLAAGVSGCGFGVLSESSSPGSGLPSLNSQALFGNPQNLPAGKTPEQEDDLTCPEVTVIEGAAAHRVGRGPGSGDLAHQASLTDVARECRFAGTQMTLKVGIQGRMLIGALGKPGTFTVPVKVQVKKGDAVVANRNARVNVTVPAGEGGASFTYVEENIVLPLPPGRDPGDDYDVYVGFEAGGAAVDSKRNRRRR